MQIPDEAIEAVGNAIGLDEFDAREALEAAAPAMEKAWRRKMAREILALHEEEGRLTAAGARNVGPYGDAVLCLRRLARGQELPKPEELRGGGR